MLAPAAAPAGDTFSDTWVATDALGRSVPTYAEVGPPRTNKFVGIFYFLWRDQVRPGPYDCTKIVAAGLQSGNTNYNTYGWGPQSAFHFWGEPYYGYYLDHDPYVLRRHAQMLTDAGIDVLIFDVTNALTYENVYLALCQVFMQIRAAGRTTPQIAFIAHSSSATYRYQTLQRLLFQVGLPAVSAAVVSVAGQAADPGVHQRAERDDPELLHVPRVLGVEPGELVWGRPGQVALAG